MSVKHIVLASASTAALGAALLAPVSASAGAFYLQEQSVRGLGRAYSGEVAEQGADALWWNPAAIARAPRQVYLGGHVLKIEGTVKDAGSTITRPVPPAGLTTPVGGDASIDEPIDSGFAPNFALALPVGERVVLGLSVAAPYNFTTEYPADAFTRYDALKSKLFTADVQGTVAFRATDWLDLGAGVSAQYTDAELTSALPNLSPLLADGRSELTGDGVDFGWTAGGQAHFDRLTLGASYRSKIEHELEGQIRVSGLLGPIAAANTASDGVAEFTTPWMATIGARYALTDQLTLNAQVQRLGWGEFDAISVTTPTAVQVIEQNYDDVTNTAVGLDYAVNPVLTVRAGVQFDKTPTPDVGRSARIPDADRVLYGAGFTYAARPSVSLDGALGYIAFDDGRINRDDVAYEGTAAAVTTRLRGDVEGSGLVLSGGLRWNF